MRRVFLITFVAVAAITFAQFPADEATARIAIFGAALAAVFGLVRLVQWAVRSRPRRS